MGPGTYDLSLANEFRRLKVVDEPIKVTDEVNFREYSEVVEVKDGEPLIIKPKETVLGITVEEITLSPHFCGALEGRSRFARLG
jgi:dCTP deaminase